METYSGIYGTAEVFKNRREWTVRFRQPGAIGGFVKDYKTKREAVEVAKYLVSDAVPQ